MISWTSSFASTAPATWSNVTFWLSGFTTFTRLRPNDMIPPEPPPPRIWRENRNMKTPTNRSQGIRLSSKPPQRSLFGS